MDSIASKLDELGITLPAPLAPVAAYVPAVEVGGFLYVSGQVSFADGKFIIGRLGETVSLDEGIAAARACGLLLLAQAKAALSDAAAARSELAEQVRRSLSFSSLFLGLPQSR